MPYQMKGGDTPSNTAWMEKCVAKVKGRPNKRTGKPFTEGEAIAVCKVTYEKSHGDNAKSSFMIGEIIDSNEKPL